MTTQTDAMEKLVALCRRRGFIFGSSEIYGGIGGFWDYGPLGTELKRNIKDVWWNDMVRNPPVGPGGVQFQMVGVDCSIIMNPKVWEASGHVGGFSDPMVDDKETKERFRADHLFGLFIEELREDHDYGKGSAEYDLVARLTKDPSFAPAYTCVANDSAEAETAIFELLSKKASGLKKVVRQQVLPDKRVVDIVGYRKNGSMFVGEIKRIGLDRLGRLCDSIPSPTTQKAGSLTPPREFNLMFQTYVGALQDSTSVAYLRPETAQGIFANFKNVVDSSRVKLPFGIAQIGKSFRNEINPRNYTFRSREFEQMEIEFFCHPSEADSWYEFWRDLRHQWYVNLGLEGDKLHLRNHEGDELAHYAKGCADVEYDFPFGLAELEGIANRTDFDLTQHKKASGKDLSYFDDVRKERFIPYVIEPSAGADRFLLAVLCEAYSYDESRASPEVMKIHPRLAPIKAAVFPLVAKDGMPEIAEPIYQEIKKHMACQYDPKQSIGKRYARMDEAGTPFCFTIDGQTKEDGTVTVRNRDDASQERIDKTRCLEYLRDKLGL